jgi:hypothetical protein
MGKKFSPYVLWALLFIPMLGVYHCKYVKQLAVVIPKVALFGKITRCCTKPRTGFLIYPRSASRLLLRIAYSEPMITTEALTIFN